MKPFVRLVYFCYPAERSLAESKHTYVAQRYRNPSNTGESCKNLYLSFLSSPTVCKLSSSVFCLFANGSSLTSLWSQNSSKSKLSAHSERYCKSLPELEWWNSIDLQFFLGSPGDQQLKPIPNSPPFGKTQYHACDESVKVKTIEKERKGMGYLIFLKESPHNMCKKILSFSGNKMMAQVTGKITMRST